MPFQFRDIRALTARLVKDARGVQAASDTLGHTNTKITKMVYLRDLKKRKPLK